MPTDLLTYLLALLVLTPHLSMVATTVASTKVFRRYRLRVCRESPWLGDLVSCPYCLGVWLAMFQTLALWFCVGPALGLAWQVQVAAAFTLWAATSFVAGVLSGVLCWALAKMDALHPGGPR